MRRLASLLEYSENIIKNLINKWIDIEYNDDIDDFYEKIGAHSEEDARQKMRDYILKFDAIKNRSQVIEKDIQRYKRFLDLMTEVDKHISTKLIPDNIDLIEDSDLLYDDNNLKIWLGDTEEKCIKYGQSGKNYCIANKNRSFFSDYRMNEAYGNMIFYFVADYDKPEDDNFRFAAIGVPDWSVNDMFKNQYHLTDQSNTLNKMVDWNYIVNEIPKLKDLKDIFKPKELTKEEVKHRAILNKIPDDETSNKTYE